MVVVVWCDDGPTTVLFDKDCDTASLGVVYSFKSVVDANAVKSSPVLVVCSFNIVVGDRSESVECIVPAVFAENCVVVVLLVTSIVVVFPTDGDVLVCIVVEDIVDLIVGVELFSTDGNVLICIVVEDIIDSSVVLVFVVMDDAPFTVAVGDCDVPFTLTVGVVGDCDRYVVPLVEVYEDIVGDVVVFDHDSVAELEFVSTIDVDGVVFVGKGVVLEFVAANDVAFVVIVVVFVDGDGVVVLVLVIIVDVVFEDEDDVVEAFVGKGEVVLPFDAMDDVALKELIVVFNVGGGDVVVFVCDRVVVLVLVIIVTVVFVDVAVVFEDGVVVTFVGKCEVVLEFDAIDDVAVVDIFVAFVGDGVVVLKFVINVDVA